MQKTKASADELIALILEGIEDVKGVDINLLGPKGNRKYSLRLLYHLQRYFQHTCKRNCFIHPKKGQ